MQSELSVIKNTVISLLTDVNLLKSDMLKAKSDILEISNTMKSGISNIEKELTACKVNIDTNLFPKLAKDKAFSCKSLSEGIAKISSLVISLEKNRHSMTAKLAEVDVNVRDNANGVDHVRDLLTSGNNTTKSHVKELQQQQKLTQSAVESTERKACDAESAVNRSANGINVVKRQIKDIENKISENNMSNLEDCFKSLALDIGAQITHMCSTVIEVTKSSCNAKTTNGMSSASTETNDVSHPSQSSICPVWLVRHPAPRSNVTRLK